MRLARRQFGVFTRAQARACGFSAYQVRRRLDTGEWQAILGPALGFAGLTVTPTVLDRAAQLSLPGSILGGPSAARTWQIPVPDDRPCVYVERHRRTRVAGVRLLLQTPAARDVSLYQGLPTVSRPAAVVDCLRLLPPTDAQKLLDRALQRGWITVAELSTRISVRAGCHGQERLIGLLRLVRGGERSPAGRLLTTLLRGAHITGWRINA